MECEWVCSKGLILSSSSIIPMELYCQVAEMVFGRGLIGINSRAEFLVDRDDLTCPLLWVFKSCLAYCEKKRISFCQYPICNKNFTSSWKPTFVYSALIYQSLNSVQVWVMNLGNIFFELPKYHITAKHNVKRWFELNWFWYAFRIYILEILPSIND